MFHRFHVTFASLLLALILSANPVQGAVYYLLIQGEFNTGTAGEETYKWKVNDTGSSLVTSLDLLNAVFGAPAANGTYADDFSGVYPYLTTGNSTTGAGYIDFGGGSLFLESFKLNSTNVAQATDYDPSWSLYVAGGSGSNYGGAYPNAGAWTYSDDGITTRQLSNGSFDGWIFGSSTFNSGTDPLTASFTGTETLISSAGGISVYSIASAPEPSRGVLLLLAGIALVTRRKRPLAWAS